MPLLPASACVEALRCPPACTPGPRSSLARPRPGALACPHLTSQSPSLTKPSKPTLCPKPDQSNQVHLLDGLPPRPQHAHLLLPQSRRQSGPAPRGCAGARAGRGRAARAAVVQAVRPPSWPAPRCARASSATSAAALARRSRPHPCARLVLARAGYKSMQPQGFAFMGHVQRDDMVAVATVRVRACWPAATSQALGRTLRAGSQLYWTARPLLLSSLPRRRCPTPQAS